MLEQAVSAAILFFSCKIVEFGMSGGLQKDFVRSRLVARREHSVIFHALLVRFEGNVGGEGETWSGRYVV